MIVSLLNKNTARLYIGGIMNSPEKITYTNEELALKLFSAARGLIDIGMHLSHGYEIEVKYEIPVEES